MAAANFSRDVLEMFYGDNFPQEVLPQPIRPNIRLGFETARNGFNDWLRVWKMRAPQGNKDIFRFFQESKIASSMLQGRRLKILEASKCNSGSSSDFLSTETRRLST